MCLRKRKRKGGDSGRRAEKELGGLRTHTHSLSLPTTNPTRGGGVTADTQI